MLNYFFNPITIAERIARKATKKFDNMISKLASANDLLDQHIERQKINVMLSQDNILTAECHINNNNKVINQLSGLVRC
jgi:hypothetical protein